MVLPAATALAIGTLGGAVFAWLGLPLPWMLGSMTAVTVCALGGVRVGLPRWMRTGCIAILGVMLGASFTPAAMARLPDWGATLSALFVFAMAAGTAGWLYFRRCAGFDRVTAFFAAAPGGLNEMVLVGTRYGGDERRIALVHATRVFVTVFSIPVWFRLHDGLAAGTAGSRYTGLAAIGLDDYVALAACALVGSILAARLRIPAATVIGPMFLSAAVHLAGITESSPPTLIVWSAQVVIGATLGCRFMGFPLRLIGKTIMHGAVAGVILVGCAVLASVVLTQVVDIPFATLLLGFAPGGLPEMSLVAIAMGADAAFVATHHLVRLVIVVLCAAPIFRALPAEDRSGSAPP